MKRRVFIAIPIAESAQSRISRAIEQINPELRAQGRFVEPEDWHSTLLFLGNQNDEAIGNIVRAMEDVALHAVSTNITFERITLGPVDSKGVSVRPRMFWLLGDRASSDALGQIRDALGEALDMRRVRFEREHRRFQLHVTLARLPDDFSAEKAQLHVPCLVSFQGTGFSLIESVLERTGAEYTTLAHFDFQERSE